MKNKGIIFAGIGFELVGLILGAVYIGGILDEKLKLNGLGISAAIILVFASWLWHLIILLKKFSKEN